jgi:hypothetical protein
VQYVIEKRACATDKNHLFEQGPQADPSGFG